MKNNDTKIKKIFVQRRDACDCEGRQYEWSDTEDSYEELTAQLGKCYDGYFSAVRVVEKSFDPDTFKITERVIKTTVRTWDKYTWTGIQEVVGDYDYYACCHMIEKGA